MSEMVWMGLIPSQTGAGLAVTSQRPCQPGFPIIPQFPSLSPCQTPLRGRTPFAVSSPHLPWCNMTPLLHVPSLMASPLQVEEACKQSAGAPNSWWETWGRRTVLRGIPARPPQAALVVFWGPRDGQWALTVQPQWDPSCRSQVLGVGRGFIHTIWTQQRHTHSRGSLKVASFTVWGGSTHAKPWVTAVPQPPAVSQRVTQDYGNILQQLELEQDLRQHAEVFAHQVGPRGVGGCKDGGETGESRVGGSQGPCTPLPSL